MAHTLQELYQLFPSLDCGFCGSPSCHSMARRTAVGLASPSRCVKLAMAEASGAIDRVQRLLQEGLIYEPPPEAERMLYTHPCVEGRDRITAEAHLASWLGRGMDLKFGLLDPTTLCWVLSAETVLREVKCSPTLGIARGTLEDKTVMAFKDGRVNIRAARDRRDSIRTVKLVSRSLWPATICPTCWSTLLECAGGGCNSCLGPGCPVAPMGLPDLLDAGSPSIQEVGESRVAEPSEKTAPGHEGPEALRRLDRAMEAFKASAKRAPIGQRNSTGNGQVEAELALASSSALRLWVKASGWSEAAFGLTLAGIALDVGRMNNGLKILGGEDSMCLGEGRYLLGEATRIATEAYQAYRLGDEGLATRTFSEFRTFKARLSDALWSFKATDRLLAVHKIAVNGSYISTVVAMPSDRWGRLPRSIEGLVKG